MKAIRFAFGSLMFVAFLASASAGQVQRTFVSGLGSDKDPCTRTDPCRTLARAISQTDARGEVYVLDSAGYGAFAINKSVSIVAPPGVTAGVSVSSGDGIDINVSVVDAVILRGLTIISQGSAGSGIAVTGGGTLYIEDCVINGFVGGSGSSGISFAAGGANLEVKDSTIRGNRFGIDVHPASGTASAAIDQVRFEGNGAAALFAEDGSRVAVRNSVASGNAFGFVARSLTGASVEMNIENCMVSNNSATGISSLSISTGVSTVRLSNSTVTNNLTGLNNGFAVSMFLSRGNNTVEGNGTDTSGPIGSYSPK